MLTRIEKTEVSIGLTSLIGLHYRPNSTTSAEGESITAEDTGQGQTEPALPEGPSMTPLQAMLVTR